MNVLDSTLETYRTRLEVDACYTSLSEGTQQGLDCDVRRYGLHSFDRVAHGVLAFCIDEGSPICVPWLIPPDAPERDFTGGIHGLVTQEFYSVADEAKLESFTNGRSSNVDVNDFIGTHVIKDELNEAPFTVICDSDDSSHATAGHVELIKDLSRTLLDHQILIGVGDDVTQRSFMKIRDGSSVELSYGLQRGIKQETIAASDDFVGKARELENYAQYAKKHKLNQWEFCELASKAVKAFRDGRQVSLDDLCQEILTERKTSPEDFS